MSASLLGLAMKAKVGSRTRKLVLIKLVDCCHEDGTRIYPALATVAEDAECSKSTARRTLKEFCAVGLLRRVREGGNGAKSTAQYEMDVDMLARLRRPDTWPALEAAAVHEPLSDDEDDEQGDAPSTQSEGDAADPSCENKGVTVTPFPKEKGVKSDIRVSSDDTQPLSRTLKDEREGRGRAHEGASPESVGDPARVLPSFEQFLDAYPHAKGDNRVRQRAAWEALAFDQRQPAIDGIGAFLAERRDGGIKGRLSSEMYLQGRCWIGLEAKASERRAKVAAGAPVTVAAWSRDWWLILFDRCRRGERVGFHVQRAEGGQPVSATEADLAAMRARVGDLAAFRCDGPELEAWRPWLAAKGARIGVLRGDFRVFLPGPLPPGGKREEADDDVRL